MANAPDRDGESLAPPLAAPQHKPRPLPLFLAMLRSETAQAPERMVQALAGLRAYQEAPRPPLAAAPPVIAGRLGAALHDYAPDAISPPILFVPSLINPPGVLDLGDRSLLRWLAARGHRPLLLDWGSDARGRRDLDIAGHVEEILLPLIAEFEQPPVLVGYCLGGTMAVAAAAVTPVRGLVTLAAPWRFAGYPEADRTSLAQLWSEAQPVVDGLGLLPMEVLQRAFWSLDPARTVAKFERFATLDAGSAAARDFVALEDWANDGPPLGAAAARDLFDRFLAADAPGAGEWRVGGVDIDPERLACPSLHIVSTADRIVPAAGAIGAGERLDLDLGHVGMVVGSRAREALWEPLDAWLSRHPAS